MADERVHSSLESQGGDIGLGVLLFHNLHLPDEVRVFTIPYLGVQRFDREALVYDVAVGQGKVLRHYSWPDRWFEVNCAFTTVGDLIQEQDTVTPWAFNCDISTPHLTQGDSVYNVDLEMDVLVAADGMRHTIKDRDEFATAVDKGWIGPAEAPDALRGLAKLLALIEQGCLREFLESVCPFDTLQTQALQPPARHRRLGEVPILRLESRSRWLDASQPS